MSTHTIQLPGGGYAVRPRRRRAKPHTCKFCALRATTRRIKRFVVAVVALHAMCVDREWKNPVATCKRAFEIADEMLYSEGGR